MKEIYKQIWESAKPFYEKGRPMDIDHVSWMMQDTLLVCEKEGIDDSILLPVVILHDVGYSKVPKKNPFGLDIRRAHMKASAEIAKKVLEKLNYPKDKTEKIVYYISVHDGWAIGLTDLFTKDKILGSFNDMDFMWMATPKGFKAVMKILSKNPKEMLDYLENDEKPILRPFSTKTAKKLFEKYLGDRRKEIFGMNKL